MRHFDAGQRAALRAKLLLGVAGAAAAASSAAYGETAAPPSDPDKWQAYTDVGGGFGTGMTAGKVDLFAPFWQDLDSMIFARMGVGTRTNVNILYDLGVGYRTKINSDWILGVYGNYDQTQLEDNNEFGQGNFGAELMSADWDVRLNGYLADNTRKVKPGAYELYIQGTEIAVLQGEDVAYTGFDGEVGYRVFSTDNTDVRFFVGGFHFTHQNADTESLGQTFNFDYHDLTGPMARAEVTVYDLDFFGPQSRLTLNGEIAHDDVRKTTGYVGATLRIPLGFIGEGNGAQALDELDRRMADPERVRDEVTTGWQYSKPEPVIIYGPHMTSQPTNTLLYVDNTLGAGTYANPTTLHDATTRTTTNAFIVLTSKQGAISTSPSGDGVMQDGQTIVGGGETFTVEGAYSHAKFTHDFAPGTVNPTITTTKGDIPITLASTTNLYGFAIKGDFLDAVYGKNVTDVNIRNLAIDGTGGGEDGIFIYRNVSGTENIDISHVGVSNVQYEGIDIASDIGDGGKTVENIALDHITISNVVYGDGIDITDYASNKSTITSNISLSNISVSQVYGNGILVSAGGYGTGSSVNQTVNISGANVSYAGYKGIDIFAGSYGGAHTMQTATVTDATISSVGFNALYGVGLYFGARSDGVGSVTTQNDTATDVTVSDVYGGIVGFGIEVKAFATSGGAVVQSATIDPSTVTDSGVGLEVYALAYDNGYGPTTVDQTVTVTGDSFTNDYYSGINIFARASTDTPGASNSQSAIYQGVTLTNVTASRDGTGVGIYAASFDGASTTQSVTFYGATITHNNYDGVYIAARAAGLGFVAQNVVFNGSPTSYNQISYNGRNGIEMNSAAFLGGLIDQHLYVYYANITGNKGDGIHVNNYAGGYLYKNSHLYYSHLQQNIILAFDNISNNSGNGISIYNKSYYGAQIDQLVDLYHVTANSNTLDGFYENSVDVAYKPGSGYDFTAATNLHSNVYIYDSYVSYNGKHGIEIDSNLESPQYKAGLSGYSYLEQHITVSGTHAYGNALDGFVNKASDEGVYGINLQYVTLSGSNFFGNGRDGAAFYASQSFGPGSFGAAEQIVTISDSNFAFNARNGLYAYALATGYQGRAEQHFTVSGSYFYFNGANGISLKRTAENGIYVSGLPCTTVQGLAGGCAFVRQTFSMEGGGASYNVGNGILVTNYANNYGAIYAESGRPGITATMVLDEVRANYNTGGGLVSTTVVKNSSYAYSYIVALDTQFNHNGANGFFTHASAYSDSSIVEKNILYSITSGTTASYNTKSGVSITDTAVTGGFIDSFNLFAGVSTGITAQGNKVDGVKLIIGYADSSSYIHQYNYFRANHLYANGREGVAFEADGPGAGLGAGEGQYDTLKYNVFNSNVRDAIYARADHSGYVSVNYATYGNVLNGGLVTTKTFTGGTVVTH